MTPNQFRIAAPWILCLFGSAAAADLPTPTEWKIGDVKREALLFLPSKPSATGAPVIFAFHGHGGRAAGQAYACKFQELWPEALVVYMQGLPTPGRFDPEGKRAGWQKEVGDQADRDLQFFDAVLATLKKEYKIDAQRIYATGHSNGGGFTYLLWSARPRTFAAVAPSAAGFRNPRAERVPIPILHVAGEKDTTVPFENQKRVMTAVRAINGCKADGKEWAKGCTIYESEKGAPFISFIHPGTHKFPPEAPPLMVRFFQEHARKSGSSQ